MSTSGGSVSRSPSGGAELLRVVDRGRRVDRDAAQLRRQRRRAVEVAALGLEALDQLGRGGAVAAVLEHPREQLLDRLLRRPAPPARRRRRAASAATSAPAARRSGPGTRSPPPAPARPRARGARRRRRRPRRARTSSRLDLLAQDDRDQQVERPGEDVELEVQLGDGHPAQLNAAGRCPCGRARRRGWRRRSRAPSPRPRRAPPRAPPRRGAARRSARGPGPAARRRPRRPPS